MLVLNRKLGDRIVLRDAAGNVVAAVTVADIDRTRVRLGVEAPPGIAINRAEIDARKYPPQKETPQ